MQTQRTTSAGYRLPLGETSAVHRIATRAEGTQTTASIKKPGSSQIDKCDEVAWNKIWREQVKNEWKGVQDWERHWGFLRDFDPKGRPKTPPALPEREPVFSETVPDTQGHVYGSRVNTELGEKMSQMEFLFHSSNRRCRIGDEFACY